MRAIYEETFGSLLKEYRETSASLPLYLKTARSFYEITLGDTRFVMVVVDAQERLNVAALKKHLPKYSDAFGAKIVYGFSLVTTFQRRSLIENGISFVSGNGQVYLPFLGAFFGKCQRFDYSHAGIQITPSAQALLLLLIYSDYEMSKSKAAALLGVSPMTVSRASADLSKLGVTEEHRSGTELLISRSGSRLDAFQKARAYLVNPIQDVIYAEKAGQVTGIPAGEYALSKRSDLGYPKYYEYAVSKQEFKQHRYKAYDPFTETDRDLIRIQTWKYDPKLFSNGDRIDPISLICSFSGEEDERIHHCLMDIEKEINAWPTMRN